MTFYNQWILKFGKSSKNPSRQPKYDQLGLKIKITEAKCQLLAISKSYKKVSNIVS